MAGLGAGPREIGSTASRARQIRGRSIRPGVDSRIAIGKTQIARRARCSISLRNGAVLEIISVLVVALSK